MSFQLKKQNQKHARTLDGYQENMIQRNCAMPKLHLAVSRLYLKNIQLRALSIWEDQVALKYTILLLQSYQKHFEGK